VTVGDRTTTQLVLHGGSYLAGMPLEATFGLGDATTADTVRVTDLRGKTTVMRDVPGDRILDIGPSAADRAPGD
jgi:hypothetical protein